MEYKKKILYIDLDGVVAGCDSDYSNKNYKSKYFFEKLKPCKNAISSIKELFASEMFDIYFLSKPSWSVPKSYTEKRIWIEKYFGDLAKKRLILTHNKGLNCGDYLIDDFIDNAKGFNGEFIHFGSAMFPDWKSVNNFLLKDYNKNSYGEMDITQFQARIKRVLMLPIEEGNIKNRVDAINYCKRNVPKATIDDINRAWLSIHKDNPDIWAKGGIINNDVEKLNKMINNLNKK